VEPTEFAERLSELTGHEIASLAEVLRREVGTADGEVSWWRATVSVGANLKRHHRSREAGLAAHRASCAILHAADHAASPPSKEDVTMVARAASEVARVLVAAHDHDVPATSITVLLAPWLGLVPATAA